MAVDRRIRTAVLQYDQRFELARHRRADDAVFDGALRNFRGVAGETNRRIDDTFNDLSDRKKNFRKSSGRDVAQDNRHHQPRGNARRNR